MTIILNGAISLILYTASAILYVLYQLFSLLTFAIPEQINEGFAYFIGYSQYITGIINVPTLFTVLGIYLNFIIVLYTWKIIRWVYAHLPWIGKHHNQPTLSETENANREIDRNYNNSLR